MLPIILKKSAGTPPARLSASVGDEHICCSCCLNSCDCQFGQEHHVPTASCTSDMSYTRTTHGSKTVSSNPPRSKRMYLPGRPWLVPLVPLVARHPPHPKALRSSTMEPGKQDKNAGLRAQAFLAEFMSHNICDICATRNLSCRDPRPP